MSTDNTLILTGAAGWLGTGLIRAWLQGLPEVPSLANAPDLRKIRMLVRPGEDSDTIREFSGRIERVEGDVRDTDACRRLTEGMSGATLIHVAGVIHPKWSGLFDSINHIGTRNLLEAAANAGLKRFVAMSSNSPCGNNPHPDHLFDESSPYHPYMGYGRSKMKMEMAVREYHEAGKIKAVTVRAPWFYGPYQPPRQTLFFRMIRDGKAPIVGGGNGLRSMAYIENLAQGLLLAATHQAADGQIYWIADERPYSMNEIVDTIERLLRDEFGETVKGKRLRLPGLASEVAGVIDASLQAVGLYHQKFHVLSEMNKTIACKIDKARKELQFQPTVALEEGMRRSLKWVYANYGGLG
ncbi:MAG: NAD-dependent epimerase/dehydratase family protein [bacterium]